MGKMFLRQVSSSNNCHGCLMHTLLPFGLTRTGNPAKSALLWHNTTSYAHLRWAATWNFNTRMCWELTTFKDIGMIHWEGSIVLALLSTVHQSSTCEQKWESTLSYGLVSPEMITTPPVLHYIIILQTRLFERLWMRYHRARHLICLWSNCI